jgi:hypothetical protein
VGTGRLEKTRQNKSLDATKARGLPRAFLLRDT